MEVIDFSYFGPKHSRAFIALFRNVSNATALKARIVKAAITEGQEGDKEREAVNFAFIDAKLITSVAHLQAAIVQAIFAETQGDLRTKTVHSEILYYLNPTHNISEAIRRYGVGGTMSDVFVVRIDSHKLEPNTVVRNLAGVITGDLVSISELTKVTDWATVRKYHKLNSETGIKEAQGDLVKERRLIDNIVTSSVAMKSVMQYSRVGGGTNTNSTYT